ncbi:MAG TPA: CapA family protein [Syntrophothermus lipocalidus]|uniref:Capsule synthesis protein, CapA n=1 Tax=Syntrophothermus lipocalidus (strain DSM 12680 / TGB-C1) TaxID=643648 RepID=D7CL39_SYNLT|nr:CapA family protein [Syntrophothermus lipocalidus]ADI01424.1 Capsule synthesis protein, CapA [Syntrophothermus lipocalidus DSM 12680]HHV76912.1 CapA family protein [Syntrophothermus lipocalidus]
MKRGCRLVLLIMFLVTMAGCKEAQPVSGTGTDVPKGIFQPKTGEMLAVGDVMLARKVERLIASQGEGYPFARLGDSLKAADLVFGNLESPLSERGRPLPGKGICFRARPSMAAELARRGFDVLSIANNHALDYDTPAFEDTLRLLGEAGIRTVGGGGNITEARSPVILEEQGLKIAFLAYTEMADIYFHPKYQRRFQATQDVGGVAPLVEADVKEDIAAVRDKVDILVLSLHWGTEYSDRPTDEQRRLAREFIDAGADIILGHHPHVIQGVERYGRGIIAYSLGNFIFDQNQKLATKQGMMLRFKVSRGGVEEVTVLPVFINESQPVVASGEEGKPILERISALSQDLGTKLTLNEDRAVVTLNPEKATTMPIEPAQAGSE